MPKVAVGPSERRLLGEMAQQLSSESRRIYAGLLTELCARYDEAAEAERLLSEADDGFALAGG